MLGQEEVNAAITELNQLDINCDFCGKHYRFDPVDCAQLFVAETLVDGVTPPSQLRH
jgi:molecular chaperone Hsp33